MSSEFEKGVLQVNSVLFENDTEAVRRTIECLNRAADLAIAGGVFSSVRLTYGDCSGAPILSEEFLGRVRGDSDALESIEYVFFHKNLGSARGHNTLLSDTNAEYTLVMNPDVRLAPTCLVELAKHMRSPEVGMVEAKQLPIEHPKVFNEKTGETSWAATACAIFPTKLLKSLEGFDADTFFLYCDDVDMSWRIRLDGKKVIYEPAAVIFHDKRLGVGGRWQVGDAEKYFSAEAALLLAYKYSRNDIVSHIIADFRSATDSVYARALKNFEDRKVSNTLPKTLDASHKVGQFIDGAYALHRFKP